MKHPSPINLDHAGLHIYMIFDKLADRYGSPVFTAVGPDQFADSYRSSIINNLQDSIRLQDCEAYEYGSFDPVSGVISPLDRPVMLFRFSDFIKEAIKANKDNPRIVVTYKEFDINGKPTEQPTA